MKHAIRDYITELLEQIVVLDSEIILLVMLIATAVIVLDSFTFLAGKKRREAGLKGPILTLGLDGSKNLPLKNYISEIQGLAGRPDALIIENGYIIPVERKPLAKKMRDRYVAQLLVYLRLVEEFEGKKPPYGYLILGPKCRRVKVLNTPERQAWLQGLIDEMRSILSGGQCSAAPHPRKCSKCDVRQHCRFSTAEDLNQVTKSTAFE